MFPLEISCQAQLEEAAMCLHQPFHDVVACVGLTLDEGNIASLCASTIHQPQGFALVLQVSVKGVS